MTPKMTAEQTTAGLMVNALQLRLSGRLASSLRRREGEVIVLVASLAKETRPIRYLTIKL